MRILEFEVRGQNLKKKDDCRFNGIISGTRGYLWAKFFFYGNDWIECEKAASFWNGDREYAVKLDENGLCEIPREVLYGPDFEVSLMGVGPAYKITTNKTEVKQDVIGGVNYGNS